MVSVRKSICVVGYIWLILYLLTEADLIMMVNIFDF